jgi:hypothetical protein
VAETFRRRKDGEEWALEMERNIDRRAAAAAAWIARREDELSKPGAIERAKADKNDPPLSDVIDRYIAESEKAIGKTKAQVLRSIKKDTLGSKACSRIDAEVICDFAKGRARGIGYSLWPRWDQRRLHARSRDGARRGAAAQIVQDGR